MAQPTVELFSTSILSNVKVRTRHERFTSVLAIKKIAYVYHDLASDDDAKSRWRRKAKDPQLPGILVNNEWVGSYDDFEEAVEFGELELFLGVAATQPAPAVEPHPAQSAVSSKDPSLYPTLPHAAEGAGRWKEPDADQFISSLNIDEQEINDADVDAMLADIGKMSFQPSTTAEKKYQPSKEAAVKPLRLAKMGPTTSHQRMPSGSPSPASSNGTRASPMARYSATQRSTRALAAEAAALTSNRKTSGALLRDAVSQGKTLDDAMEESRMKHIVSQDNIDDLFASLGLSNVDIGDDEVDQFLDQGAIPQGLRLGGDRVHKPSSAADKARDEAVARDLAQKAKQKGHGSARSSLLKASIESSPPTRAAVKATESTSSATATEPSSKLRASTEDEVESAAAASKVDLLQEAPVLAPKEEVEGSSPSKPEHEAATTTAAAASLSEAPLVSEEQEQAPASASVDEAEPSTQAPESETDDAAQTAAPTAPTDAAGALETAAQVEPVEPVEPAEPVEAVEPEEAPEPTKAVEAVVPVEAAEARHSSEAVEASATAESSIDVIELTRSEDVGLAATGDVNEDSAPLTSQDTEASAEAPQTRASLEEPSEEQFKAAPALPHDEVADAAASLDRLEPSASSASIPNDSHTASEDVAKAEDPDVITEAAIPVKMPEIPTRADSQPGSSKVDTDAPTGADDELQVELANAAMIASRYEEHRSEALDPVAASADAEPEPVENLAAVSASQETTTSSSDAAVKVPTAASNTSLAQSVGSAGTHASISDVASSSRSSAATKHGSRQASSSSSIGASSSSRRAFDVSRPIVPTNVPQPLPRSSSSELSTSPDAKKKRTGLRGFSLGRADKEKDSASGGRSASGPAKVVASSRHERTISQILREADAVLQMDDDEDGSNAGAGEDDVDDPAIFGSSSGDSSARRGAL
ncbi:uncharacterized protein PAN0_016d5365 [Moesziomyces antarcticus]|uniref:Uncharacterized protein n=2 Tax=Pseudozyma antarctica TaxID=84753 RepID=A0A5C3FVF5_PSEA2|nr:uncharacterized protein PAN0_016d5365 [Moesziomyces antarcticus]GAK67139.1 hypothetical protein PAN0_016d5365 [Moesziomyces antarcticus]SPO48393.1 uncharacterized protein PSANT_06082 [Moesziomyces antarcticus]